MIPRFNTYQAADHGWRTGWNVYNIEERVERHHYAVVGRRIIGAYVVLGSRCVNLQWRRP